MQLKPAWDDLSPATRVLLFLQTVKEVKMWAGARIGAEDTTQKGISTKLGLSVSRLSKLLAPLTSDGLVVEQRVRIPGLRRSPLAFALTDRGTAATLEAMKGILARHARQLDAEGLAPEMALVSLCRSLGMDVKTASVTRRTPGAGPTGNRAPGGPGRPRVARSAGPELVDLRDAVQISPHFVGRKKELAELGYFLKGGPARLFTIIGPAAIGKTSLVSRFVMSAMKTVSVAFHICREWDTLRNVLEPVAELLARMGRRRLQFFIRGELNPITIPDAAAILKTDLHAVSALLIFDDIQKLPFDFRPLLKVFLSAIGPVETGEPSGELASVKVVTTSREPITGVFDHRELVVKELVREMELRGLTVEETLELLEKENAKGLPAEKVHRMTGGHPLYIELITRSGMTGAVRDFRKFMGTEVMGRLSDEERAVLGCLTVFRMPVPSSALQIPQATPETLDRLVKLGLVNEASPDEYLALDIVIETVYRALKNQDKRLYHATAARYHRGLKSTENIAEAMHHLLLADDLLGALELGSENIHPVIQLGHRDLVEKILEESKNVEMPVRGIVAASKIRSELALSSGEWRIAQIHLEKALSAVKGDAFQEGALLMAQANALREQGQMEEALAKFFDAEKAAKSVYDLPTMAGVYRGIGKIHWRMGDLEQAMDFLKKSLDYLKAAEMGAEHGETLIDMGVVQSRLGNRDKAIEYYNRAIEELKKGSWLYPLARAYNNIGVEYLLNKDLKEAIRVWEKTIELYKEVGNKRGLIYALANVSNPYSQNKHYNRAIKCLDNAINIVNETDDNIARALVLYNYGMVYAKMKKWPVSFQKFEESLEIYGKSENNYDHAITLFQYGKALADSGAAEKALVRLNESLKLFTKCESKDWVKEVKDLLHQLESTKPPG